MFCSKCGEILDDNARRCPVCGASQKKGASRINEDCDCDTNKGLSFSTSRPKTHSTFREGSGWAGKTVPDTAPSYTYRTDKVSIEDCIHALKTFFLHYSDFHGRTDRREFWVTYLTTLVITLALYLFGDVLSAFWCLATAVPTLALTVRRLNDTDHGRWWMLLIGLLFPLGTGILLYALFQPSAPKTWADAK